jgi:hypothetical protein
MPDLKFSWWWIQRVCFLHVMPRSVVDLVDRHFGGTYRFHHLSWRSELSEISQSEGETDKRWRRGDATEELLQAMFSVRSVTRLYNENQLQKKKNPLVVNLKRLGAKTN